MSQFQYRDNELYIEDVPLSRIAAEAGTPTYVYSSRALAEQFHAFDNAFAGQDHLICYAVKANFSLAVMRLFANYGGGADVVSGGELFRALKAGVPAKRICFSGVGKTEAEIKQALEAGILMFNVESMAELETLNRLAGQVGQIAPMAVRVNPDVNPKTHPYISTGLKKNKFGLDMEAALEAYATARDMASVNPIGIDCHIGSQLTEISPFVEAVKRLKGLIEKLTSMGVKLKYLDIGGGLGITYKEENPPQPLEYAVALGAELAGLGLTLILEPGRVMVGNAGALLAKVVYVKQNSVKKFLIVDVGMNDLLRPALYQSYHYIQPLKQPGEGLEKVDVVGPICESSDFLAQDRDMPPVEAGEYLAVMSAGAYGMTMSSQYNARPRAAEVMVSGSDFTVVRERETFEDLIKGESIPDFLIRS